MSGLKTNLNEVSKKFDRLIKHLTKDGIKQAIDASLQLIGFVAVSDHMIQTDLATAIGAGVDSEKLTMRTGRLAGSLMSAPRFSTSQLPTEISSYFMKSKPKTIKKLPGGSEGIHRVTVTGTNIEGEKGTIVPYGAIHEYGGTTKPHVIVPKRASVLSFGGRFYKKVNHPGSNIPARPYLTPALTGSQDKISTIFQMAVKSEGRLLGFV